MFDDTDSLPEAWAAPASGLEAGAVHGIAADEPDWFEMNFGEPLLDDCDPLTEPLSVLAVDMMRYCLALRFSWVQALVELGVSQALAARLSGRAAVGRCRVSERDGLWSEVEGGPLPGRENNARLILAVWDEFGLTDLLALNSADRNVWSLRRGEASVLGAAALNRAQVFGEGRLRLFGTPIDWLIGGCGGVCVLKWDRAALSLLRGLPAGVTLVTDGPGEAAALGEMLKFGALPKVASARSGRGLE